jgi:hypothetical protein
MARAGRHSLVLNIGVVFLVMSTVLYILSITVADPDLWGHIKFGEDLWQTGKIIQSDPYSYLSGDRLWINHEWLAEAIFYLGFALTGPAGLIVLKVAVGLLIAGLVYRHLCRQGLTPLRAGIVLLPVTPLLVPGLVTVRPQMFTYLFFLFVLLLIYQAEHGRPQYLWLAPPLFALWVNLHGGFLAGLGILLLWFFTHLAFVLLRARQPRALSLSKLAMPVAVSVLATLLNPYGVELLVFLLRTATVARPDITEWRPNHPVRLCFPSPPDGRPTHATLCPGGCCPGGRAYRRCLGLGIFRSAIESECCRSQRAPPMARGSFSHWSSCAGRFGATQF